KMKVNRDVVTRVLLLAAQTGAPAAAGKPLSGLQAIRVAGQDHLPIEQGLFMLSDLLQERGQSAPGQGIGRTYGERAA
ncbi:MAG: hypothetical protein AB7V39_27720, partial [Nitrospiraceae bacterium]